MIRKYRYGTPFNTEALTEKIETTESTFPYGEISQNDGFAFTYIMDEDDIVYGLGESNRGINKRGDCYISNCADDPVHTEDKRSLYGAHNFIVVSGKTTFGLFFDYPSELTFDIGYTRMDTLKVSCENADLDIYVIEGENAYDIVKQFRHVIGRSYIPPKFAFGFGQSRWGYTTKEDFRAVAKGYRENHIPIDMIYMDIDYMQSFKDFTVSEENFPDFPEFVQEMKFDRLGAFTYSPEEGTKAAEMENQIPEETKKLWQQEVMELQEEIIFEKNEDMVDRELYAFIEGKVADENAYVGRTYRDAPSIDGYIFVNTEETLMTGDFAKVKVTGAYEYDLIGELA